MIEEEKEEQVKADAVSEFLYDWQRLLKSLSVLRTFPLSFVIRKLQDEGFYCSSQIADVYYRERRGFSTEE